MKSVLISIQPKWVEKICTKIGEENGKPIYKKSIEVRKTRPKIETPFKCNIYCTKGASLWLTQKGVKSKTELAGYLLNGKVIGEFVCDRIDEYVLTLLNGDNYITKDFMYYPLKDACLTQDEIVDYGKGKDLYGWHISDLKIYDKPKELSEFTVCKECVGKQFNYCGTCKGTPITRPPQSWCYVESLGE